MRFLIHEDFLLQTKEASRLYHDYAKDLPIIDYHNHLIPKEIVQDIGFNNISQVWLGGDHYKWRAMRTYGIDEEYITGNANSKEKFLAWAQTVPALLRNPLYHWTHLELARYFDIREELLSPQTAESIYNRCNELLSQKDFTAQSLLKKMKVEVLCTTDDPVDNLEYHRQFAEKATSPFQLYPAWRPDKLLKIDDVNFFNRYVGQLEQCCQKKIKTYSALMECIKERHDFFHQNGCRISDYGVETMYAEDYTDNEINRIFQSVREGKQVSFVECNKFRSAIHHDLCLLDHSKGWVLQLHIGPIRNNNTRFYKRLGPDSGFDSIGDAMFAKPLARFLDRLDKQNQLAKTIIYPINPRDYALVATMIGNFQEGTTHGKIQFGSGWWFMDQKDGIEEQLNSLSNMGLISTFIGMTTDSRSLLSFTRHEYFRRILCNLLGNDMHNGLIPGDMDLVGDLVQKISYYNAKSYFPFAI